MINQELRIGNLISDGNNIREVVHVYTNVVGLRRIPNTLADTLDDSYVNYPTSRLSGIALDDTQLSKLGFVKCNTVDKSQHVWGNGNLIIHKYKKGYCINKRIVPLLYVHQLQNIYFFMKGKELIYKI